MACNWIRNYFFLFSLAISTNCIYGQKNTLPLVIGDAIQTQKPMILYVSGDGGWNSFDKKMAFEFKMVDMPYVALNSFKYFWKSKTPDQFAIDMIPVLREYAKKWDKNEIIFIGYSFGADVMPFLISRLPIDLKKKVKLIALITPGKTSDFTIHLNDMLLIDGTYKYKVPEEIEKIHDKKIICFFGQNEDAIFPYNWRQDNVKTVIVKGGHSFYDSEPVMKAILAESK